MTEKRIFKQIVALVLACLCLFALASCTTTLKGTYTSDGLIQQSFTFKEDNVVEVSAFGIEVEGTYEIEDDQITVTYSLLGLHYDWVKSFRKDGNSIFIDGTEFIKQQ